MATAAPNVCIVLTELLKEEPEQFYTAEEEEGVKKRPRRPG